MVDARNFTERLEWKKRENEELFQLFKNYFIEYGMSLRYLNYVLI